MQEAVCYTAGRREVTVGGNVTPVGGDDESSKLRPPLQLLLFFPSHKPQNVHSDLRWNQMNLIRKVCFGFLMQPFHSRQWGEEETSSAEHGTRKQTFYFRMNENNIAHNNPTSLLSARLPAYSISLTTKTVSPDLASDVHSTLDTSVWLSITTGLFGMQAASLFFCPIHNFVKGEQFRCYKSQKGE